MKISPRSENKNTQELISSLIHKMSKTSNSLDSNLLDMKEFIKTCDRIGLDWKQFYEDKTKIIGII